MKSFAKYVTQLEALARVALRAGVSSDISVRITDALDGGPNHAVRQAIGLDMRRKKGVFFTARVLAERSVAGLVDNPNVERQYMDPACGAGDLLLATSRLLPLAKDVSSTVQSWGQILAGRDVDPNFVRATKARLMLEVIRRGASSGPTPLPSNPFPNITVGNGLGARSNETVVVLLNPPYSAAHVPVGCQWASGKVTMAALFLESIIVNASPGARVFAILPDVLRAGTRYSKWRQQITNHANIDHIESFGRFDNWTDIDVFIVHLTVAKTRITTATPVWTATGDLLETQKVGDFFDVHVGPVVPHRHEHKGPWHPFVTARNLPVWTSVDVSTSPLVPRRRFNGTLFDTPFVVVRRTSRPGDGNRAIGTVIVGNTSVAVENHLLVLRPKDGKLSSCNRLLQHLRETRTTKWLNERIRCRHLTVSSVHELPWWSDADVAS